LKALPSPVGCVTSAAWVEAVLALPSALGCVTSAAGVEAALDYLSVVGSATSAAVAPATAEASAEGMMTLPLAAAGPVWALGAFGVAAPVVRLVLVVVQLGQYCPRRDALGVELLAMLRLWGVCPFAPEEVFRPAPPSSLAQYLQL
jgi:hypothetical protein